MKLYRPRRPVSSDRRFSPDHSLAHSTASLLSHVVRSEIILSDAFVAGGQSVQLRDAAPPERWQHAGRVLEPTDSAGVVAARVVEECVLDVLFLQRHISRRMLEGALRLKADYLAADLSAHLVAGYNPARVAFGNHDGPRDRSDSQEKAYQRWRGAIASIGEMMADAVITTVCHDIAPDEAHILPLQIGLIRLTKYYGIPKLDDNVDQASTREIGPRPLRSEGAQRSRLLH